MEQEKNTQNNPQQESIQALGSVLTENKQGKIYTLTIIGQIEGHQVLSETTKTTKYEHVLPLLASVEESDEVDGLLILLNTVGGDIEAGLAIAELISGMKKPTVSLVLGGGHSIGVPLAVSAKRSFIAPSAGMTIHPVRMSGTVVGAPAKMCIRDRGGRMILNPMCDSGRQCLQPVEQKLVGAVWKGM